jgi:prepilin-type N-terminal cleavage/methylation domain-containing protein
MDKNLKPSDSRLKNFSSKKILFNIFFMKSLKYSVSHRGFTLVELIITVTVVALLSTIAFLAFGNGYAKNARDAKRVDAISMVYRGISTIKASGKSTVLPDDAAPIKINGTIVGYQGKLSPTILAQIAAKMPIQDEFTGKDIIYRVDARKKRFQLMTYLEQPKGTGVLIGAAIENLGIETAHANDGAIVYPYAIGDVLGIYLEKQEDGSFIAPTGSGAEIVLSTSSTGVILGDGHSATPGVTTEVINELVAQKNIPNSELTADITNFTIPATVAGAPGEVVGNSTIFGVGFNASVSKGIKVGTNIVFVG